MLARLKQRYIKITKTAIWNNSFKLLRIVKVVFAVAPFLTAFGFASAFSFTTFALVVFAGFAAAVSGVVIAIFFAMVEALRAFRYNSFYNEFGFITIKYIIIVWCKAINNKYLSPAVVKKC
jgi:hypothetical protein